jgi:hypothetical protein
MSIPIKNERSEIAAAFFPLSRTRFEARRQRDANPCSEERDDSPEMNSRERGPSPTSGRGRFASARIENFASA